MSVEEEKEECPLPKKPEGVNLEVWRRTRSWCDLVVRYSRRNKVNDPFLVASVIYIESGGDPLAYSVDGAVGLMQVVPRDGIAAKFDWARNRPTIKELEDPEFNVDYGTDMLSGLIDNFGVRDGLRKYGPSLVGYDYADDVLYVYSLLAP